MNWSAATAYLCFLVGDELPRFLPMMRVPTNVDVQAARAYFDVERE